VSALKRIAVVVHPTRDVRQAVARLRGWAHDHGVELVQLRKGETEPQVAPMGDAREVDLVVAIGGDGTVLGGLRIGAKAGRPVLGVACGSLGVLATVAPERLEEALDRAAGGACARTDLPVLEVRAEGAEPVFAFNDAVVLRAGAGQVRVAARLDGTLYARWSGDGLILATALGSSAYTLAAGGPVVAPPAAGTVLTALSPHGGCIPPLVAGPEARWEIEVDPGHAGARFELDGQPNPLPGTMLEAILRPGAAQLLRVGDEMPFLTVLRGRGIITDSARIVADERRDGG
jgi:NAD+ kinase